MADDDTAPVPEAFAKAELPKQPDPSVPDSAKATDGEKGAGEKTEKESSTSTTGKDTTSGVPVGKLLGWAVPVLGLTAGVAMYNQSPILAVVVFGGAFMLASALLTRHLLNKRTASRADKTAGSAPRAARTPRQRGEPGRFSLFRNLGGGGRRGGLGKSGGPAGPGKSGAPGGGGGRWSLFKSRTGTNPAGGGSKAAPAGPKAPAAKSPTGPRGRLTAPTTKPPGTSASSSTTAGGTPKSRNPLRRRRKSPGTGTTPAGGPGKKKPASGAPRGGGSTSSTTSTGSGWNPLRRRRDSTSDGRKRAPRNEKPKSKTNDGGPSTARAKAKEDPPANGGKRARWWNPLSWGSTASRNETGSADAGTGKDTSATGRDPKAPAGEGKTGRAKGTKNKTRKDSKKAERAAQHAEKVAATNRLLDELGPLDPSGFQLLERPAGPSTEKKPDPTSKRPAEKPPLTGAKPAVPSTPARQAAVAEPSKAKAEPGNGTDDGGFFVQPSAPLLGKPDRTDTSPRQPATDDGGFLPCTTPSGKETKNNRGTTGITVATITNAKSSPINTNSTTTTREFSVATVGEYASRVDVSNPKRLKQSLFDIANKARADAKEKDELAEDLKLAAVGLGDKVGYKDDSVDLAIEARKAEEDAAERRALAIVFTNKANEIKVS